jgi:hypothetical protein
LPAEPPDVRTPSAWAGKPNRSEKKRTKAVSIAVAAGPISKTAMPLFKSAETCSAKAASGSGAVT